MPQTDLQRQAETLRQVAEERLAARLAATAELDHHRRCPEPEQNLVATIRPAEWSVISAQLNGGNGGELKSTSGDQPKFCSAFSSCALAVNTFGPFVEFGSTLTVPGAGSYTGPVEFEAQRSAGTVGYKPHLDLVAEPDDNDWLFVESKCLEYLRPHTTSFSDAFVTKARTLLGPETAAVYKRFKREIDKHPHGLLDTAQLLKHFLAAKLAAGKRRAVTLAYVYWEPSDAPRYEPFVVHREQACHLAEELVDDEAKLIAVSYPELWEHWDRATEHLNALRARYDVALDADR
jgi:hypothetical protein